MPILQRRRAAPFFLERGETACLLLHGFSGSPAEVRPLGEYLAGQGVTVRAPLLPGHGTTPEELRETGWPEWVRAAEAELAVLQARYARVHLVGFSMGGLIALYLTAHHGASSVTTLAAPVRLADWRQVLVPLARYLIPYYPARISNPEIAAQVESYDRFPVDGIHSLLRLAKQVRKDLPRITAPVLALQGERDRWIDPESADYILEQVRSPVRAKRVLEGRHHFLTLEQGRDEVFRAVHAWLRQDSFGAPTEAQGQVR